VYPGTEANSLKNAPNPREHLVAKATLINVVCLTACVASVYLADVVVGAVGVQAMRDPRYAIPSTRMYRASDVWLRRACVVRRARLCLEFRIWGLGFGF